MEVGEEEDDLEAIQAHLDMTMALTYEAVEASFKNSTLPDDMVYETIDTFKPRPPRLGVGATRRDPTTNSLNTTILGRETARLHRMLAGKKRIRDEGDSNIGPSAPTSGLKRMHLQSDDSDEEESRARTIVNKEKDKGKGKSFDKFAVQSKQKSKGSKPSETATGADGNGRIAITGPGNVSTFSGSISQEATRFVAPAPPKPPSPPTTRAPKAGSSSMQEDIYSLPRSTPRILSPSISRSSSAPRTSRHSSLSLSHRTRLKQNPNALWRIVSVEPVSPSPAPPPPPLFAPRDHVATTPATPPTSEQGVPTAPTPPPKPQNQLEEWTRGTAVLQLEPLTPSVGEGDGKIATGTEGMSQSQKKRKRRRRKRNKKKHSDSVLLEENEEEAEEDKSD